MSIKSSQSLVIIGNGMATGRFLDDLHKFAPGQYTVTVIGDEAFGSYNRIMLSSVLAGTATIDEIIQKPASWYEQNNVALHCNARVMAINKHTKTVDLNDGRQLSYDHLVIATGSRSSTIPAKNQGLDGVFSFRNIEDTQHIEQWCVGKKHALVVGGGLLGLEAAYGLSIKGIKVTLVHRNRWLMNRQLDEASGKMLKATLEAKNIHFELACEVSGFNQLDEQAGNTWVKGASLTNGVELDVDLVVIATGITPNSELGKAADLDVNRAITVNDYLLTSDEYISALGECCEHRGETFGLVEPIWAQSKILAQRLSVEHASSTSEVSHYDFKGFNNVPTPTKLKVSGVQIFSAGMVQETADCTAYHLIDASFAIYRKLIFKNNKLVGIVLFGDVSSGMYYFNLMQAQQVIAVEHAQTLLFGEDFYLSQQILLANSLDIATVLEA